MLLIEGLRSLQRPTYLQTPIGGHHHQLRSLDLVGQLTMLGPEGVRAHFLKMCIQFNILDPILICALYITISKMLSIRYETSPQIPFARLLPFSLNFK